MKGMKKNMMGCTIGVHVFLGKGNKRHLAYLKSIFINVYIYMYIFKSADMYVLFLFLNRPRQ